MDSRHCTTGRDLHGAPSRESSGHHVALSATRRCVLAFAQPERTGGDRSSSAFGVQAAGGSLEAGLNREDQSESQVAHPGAATEQVIEADLACEGAQGGDMPWGWERDDVGIMEGGDGEAALEQDQGRGALESWRGCAAGRRGREERLGTDSPTARDRQVIAEAGRTRRRGSGVMSTWFGKARVENEIRKSAVEGRGDMRAARNRILGSIGGGRVSRRGGRRRA